MSHFTSAMRRTATSMAVALTLLVAGAVFAEDTRPQEMPYETPGEFPQLSPDYNMSSHKVVLITDNGLNPRLATLDEGQLVAWISYSGEPSTVVSVDASGRLELLREGALSWSELRREETT